MIITEAAETQVNKLITDNAEGKLLRLSVIGQGCSGYSYAMAYDEPKDTDEIVGNVCVDAISWGYLAELTVDYIEKIEGSGFSFSNPAAVRTCGCGKSFS